MGGWVSRTFGSGRDVGTEHLGPSVIDRISQDQLDEFKAAFDCFDKDGGGSIDTSELQKLMASIGQHPTNEELHAMISMVDGDGTGDLSFEEFVTLMAHNMADDSAAKLALQEAFAVWDRTGDGYLGTDELKRIMINCGEQVTLDDVEGMVRRADVDGDGMLNYEEFSNVITSGGASSPESGARVRVRTSAQPARAAAISPASQARSQGQAGGASGQGSRPCSRSAWESFTAGGEM